MTKQECIQQAWGDLWEKLHEEGHKEAYNNNGWTAPHLWLGKTVSESMENYNADINTSSIDLDYVGMPTYLLRPESLRGLETNNGWTKLESEDDLPPTSPQKYKVFYNGPMGYFKKEPINFDAEYTSVAVGLMFKQRRITHYKLAKEDPKPLY